MALDSFERRYAPFRSELHPRERVWFDELVCRARRHSSAINRRPHMDFERPVMLAMMMEGMRELEDTRSVLDATRRQLDEACRALSEHGIVRRRLRMLSPEQMGRIGQRRLEDLAS
jgi:hypothetical protein